MHPIRLAALSCLFFAAIPMTGARGEEETALTQSRVVEPNELIGKKLEAPANGEFVDTPLNDVLVYFSDTHGFPIIIDEIALKENGIPLDTPLNLVLDGITLRSALKIVLEPLGLVFVVEDETLFVTSSSRGEQRRSTRFYAVEHLLHAGLSKDQLVEAVEHVATHGRVTPLNNLLLVTDSGHNHAEVERLLKLLALKLKPAAGDE